MLRTRGKRVVAEALIPNALIEGVMRTSTEMMFRARQVSQLGGFMSGVTNNGSHSANGVTAIFIATGQDAANVAESSAAFVYAELRENGDYYYSITIPSLIVATYGGGTGLPTQRECLELLGCYGTGKVQKFAEIVAATVLCGEISLGAAVVAEEWVDAHDLLGRNRPSMSLPFQPRSLRASRSTPSTTSPPRARWSSASGRARRNGRGRVRTDDRPGLPGAQARRKLLLAMPSFYVGNHTALRGRRRAMPWPSHTDCLDFELELGFVLDRRRGRCLALRGRRRDRGLLRGQRLERARRAGARVPRGHVRAGGQVQELRDRHGRRETTPPTCWTAGTRCGATVSGQRRGLERDLHRRRCALAGRPRGLRLARRAAGRG